MIKIVEGNLLKAKEDIIGQQVNCQGVMGSGLAKQIRAKYPEVFTKYKQFCISYGHPYNLLGEVQLVSAKSKGIIKKEKIIANLFGH